ncbi:Mkp3, partial [Symbiodinium sp. KB8]
EEWDDHSELRFLSPALFRKGIEVLATRPARGWSVVVIGRKNHGRRGFSGRPGALVESVERLSCSLEEFYSQFPFLEPGNPDFELVRLYPSLMALVGAETRLFLSNWGVASDPHTYNALGIKYVVNCSPEQQPIHAQLRVKLAGRLRVPVQDGADQRICDHFLESVEFLEKSVGAQSGHILIHCKHGQSRSATVLAAFMLHVAKQMGTPKTAEEVLVQLR